MLKKELDYKLVNLAIIALIVFLVQQTATVWFGFASRIFSVIVPFFFAFVIAYVLDPIVRLLKRKDIGHGFSVAIVIFSSFALLGVIVGLVIPLLLSQVTSLANNVMEFVKTLTATYDFGPMQGEINEGARNLTRNVSSYVSEGAFGAIGQSLSFLTTLIVIFASASYFLADFDRIREGIKKYLLSKGLRKFEYVKQLDIQLKNYLKGLSKVMVIAFFEYSIALFIIRHPHALLLGFLAAPANLIPYFGGFANNLLANITAFAISPALGVRTLIMSVILVSLDGYVINPTVYGKSNKIHPVVVIFSVFAGGSLFGTIGILLGLPIAIIILTSYDFFKKDIEKKLAFMRKEGKI